MEIKNFSFLKDEPITPGTVGYFEFYHKYFSPALKDMILSDSCPHTIGLFSKWGTGKSSIIDQLKTDLPKNIAKVFIFDAWKYQEDSLRRTFLIKFEEFLKREGYTIPLDALSGFYKNRSSSTSRSGNINSENTVKGWRRVGAFFKSYWQVLVFLVLPLVILGTFNVLLAYHPSNDFLIGVKNFCVYLTTLSWFVFFLKPVADKFLDKISGNIFASTKQYTEIRTQIEEEERLNSPEQFEAVFNKLISHVDDKLVIVFDNIDRVHGDVALKTLSTIKTFLDPEEKSKVVFVVPCDSDAINQQIKAFYKNEIDENFDESEYLKKLFNVIIYTPEFIDDDIYQYANDLIAETGDLKDLLSNEQIFLVIKSAFKNNPREIKQFINNLIAVILVVSKSEVSELLLNSDAIGFLAKVTVLKQKFPEAYKKLKENWSDPQGVLSEHSSSNLKDFLTLTSVVTTNNAEPYIYFKAPQIERDLNDSVGIRKTLIEGNVEEFEKLAATETKKDKLIRFIGRLLSNYKSQPLILFQIFKTQLQGLADLNEQSSAPDFLNNCIDAIEAIWNNYLKLPPGLIFDLLIKSNDHKRRESIFDRYVLALGTEEIKIEENKIYLHDLINELIRNERYLTATHQLAIMDAIRQNLVGRDDILLQFTTLDIQTKFIAPENLRRIIQEALNNRTLKHYLAILDLYKEYIGVNNLGPNLISRIPQLISLENSEMPNASPRKLEFHDALLQIFTNFASYIKDIPPAQQQEIFNGLNTTYQQVGQDQSILAKITNSLRWLSLRTTDANTKTQADAKVNAFISQVDGTGMKLTLKYWSSKSKIAFINNYFDSIKARANVDDSVLMEVYEVADESQKITLIDYIIKNRGDSGLGFLQKIGNSLPDRIKIINLLLSKAEVLAIQDRKGIFDYLRNKIDGNDDATVKQTAIKEFLNFLKSKNQDLIQFGTSLLNEPFLNDSDHREITKEMLAFYNNPPDILQKHDLSFIDYLIRIEAKLQNPLKETLVYLIFKNISPDRPFEIIPALIEDISLLKPNSDKYEKDYSDLIGRVSAWTPPDQKLLIVQQLNEAMKGIPGKKTKDYIAILEKLVSAEKEAN